MKDNIDQPKGQDKNKNIWNPPNRNTKYKMMMDIGNGIECQAKTIVECQNGVIKILKHIVKKTINV